LVCTPAAAPFAVIPFILLTIDKKSSRLFFPQGGSQLVLGWSVIVHHWVPLGNDFANKDYTLSFFLQFEEKRL